MRRRTVFFCLALIAGGALTLSGGFRRSMERWFVETSPDPVRASLRAPLESLGGGNPRAAVKALLGQGFNEAAWRRTEGVLQRQTARGGGSAVEQCRQNLVAIATAIELFRADETNGYRMPPSLRDIVGPNGLARIPICPAAGRDTYSAGYAPDRRNEHFRLVCRGHAHAAAGLDADLPRYDPRFGAIAPLQSRAAWWPMPYRVDVVSLDRRGSSARVTLREMKARCVTLDLRAAQDGRWTVARVLDDDSTLLGATLSAYPVVAAAAAPARAVDGRQTCALSLARVATALEEWSCDHGGRYPPTLDALVPEYLPQAPAACCEGEGHQKPLYRVSAQSDRFDLSCGGAHADVHLSSHPAAADGRRRVSHLP